MTGLGPVVVAILAVAGLLVAEYRGSRVGEWLSKPVASAAFLWFGFTSGAMETRYGQLILLGLGLCMLGDLLLIPRDKPGVFRAGLFAFLAGHVAYSAAFLTRPLAPAGLIAGGLALAQSMVNQMGLKKRILLFPNFAPEIKQKLYQASDFYLSIIDNFQETFGLTVLEAMASGLPVVSSDFSGYRAFISHGREGFLIPTTWAESMPEFLRENMGILDPSMARLYLSQMVAVDLEKLKAAILRLARDEKLRFRMGGAAKSKALTYRW